MADDGEAVRAAVTPYVQGTDFTLYLGDAREGLAQLDEGVRETAPSAAPDRGHCDSGSGA